MSDVALETLEGSCHCGAVRVRVASRPNELNNCQCEHCQKRGALWAYYSKAEIDVSGETATYCWGDRELEFHFCASCGCSTHWTAIDRSVDRVGLNARLLGKAIIQSTPTRNGPGPVER